MSEEIALDASAYLNALFEISARGEEIRGRLSLATRWLVPEFFDLECLNYCRKSEPGPSREAKIDLVARGLQNSLIDRVETYEFLPRISQLLANVTAFDAAYVVTAEAYEVPLITSDRRLSRSLGPRCDFMVF